MLSYRHAFHAGNFADLLKHIVLSKTILYLLKKTSPITYIDTHSGAGSYSLSDPKLQKMREIDSGVNRLDGSTLKNICSEYADIVSHFKAQGVYPGSPSIAKKLLRKNDLLFLSELHPNDHMRLEALFDKERSVKVIKNDGYKVLNATLPCKGRRALVLIDPSYEIKSEYAELIQHLTKAYKKMPNATFLVWYPVIDRTKVTQFLRRIEKTDIKDIQVFELGIRADNEGYGMTASGVIAINPPWTLLADMREALGFITQEFGKESFYKCQQLKDE